MNRITLSLQRLIGVLFLIAGIGKFSTAIEDPYLVLEQARISNLHTWLAPLSAFAVVQEKWLIPLIGTTMILTGIALLANRGPVRLSIIILICMVILFVMMLWRAYPQIFIIDGLIITALFYLLRKR